MIVLLVYRMYASGCVTFHMFSIFSPNGIQVPNGFLPGEGREATVVYSVIVLITSLIIVG